MSAIFESILHMSGVASIVILVVILLRLCLKKAPKVISYALWAVVLLRLLCPFTVESALSVIPKSTPTDEVIEEWSQTYTDDFISYHDIRPEYQIAVDAGVEPIYMPGGGSYVNVAPDGVTPAATVETEWMPILSVIWLCGIAAMAIWSIASYIRLRRRLVGAMRESENIYVADGIASPFVLGLVRPKIYLPSGMGGHEREYILLHERCHIRRGDHWLRVLAFAALAIHWFNPLVWLAFVLSGRDMEMSCDEAVVKTMGAQVRADYSASLLSLATGRRVLAGMPLAFGEGDTRGRIRNLANWKKPTIWIIIAAVAVCIIAAVCLLTDPVSPKAQIRVHNNLYTYSGRERNLPRAPGVMELGELRSVLHESSEPPTENFQATNLEPKYAGQPLFLPDINHLYLYDEEGFYLVFQREEDAVLPELPYEESEGATEVFSGDFDHDGEDETVVVAPDPRYADIWNLQLMNPDGSIAWSEEGFATSHAGWKCILAYEGEDGFDYLIRYNPAMFQGIANYRCEQFYIDNRNISSYKEVLRQEWSAAFEIPTEMTSEMEEFADAMEILLSRSYVLLSTLGGELHIGPTRGDVAGLLPVDFGFSHEMEAWEAFCKGALADMMAAEVSHYTWDIYIDGVHRTDMPQNEGWFCSDDWLYRSESIADEAGMEMISLEKDGVQYMWSSNGQGEFIKSYGNNELAAYGRGVFDVFLDYDLSFVSETETADGTELVFEINTGGDPVTALQTYVFDSDMRLTEIRIESNSDLRESDGTVTTGVHTIIITFPRVSEAMCRGMIEEAYEHFAEEELDLYELLDTIKAGDITVLWPYDAVDAGTLAMALNGLDESDAVAERSEDGNLIEWSLWPYLEGGEDGTNYAMRHLELACGPDEDYVLVRLVDSGRSRQEWFKDETLYDLLRHMRDYEELVEREGREKYGEIIDNILREYLEEYKGNPMEFKSAELTRLVYLGGYDHADGSRVDIYDFRFAFVPTSIKTNALAGGAYIDSELRVQGFGPTHMAVKHKTGADVEYAVLSDSFFIYSGGEVNAEKRDIIERNLQSAAPNGAPADAIIDDGSSYPLAIPYGKTVITDLDGDGVKETVRQTVNGAGYRIDSFTINGVEYIDTVREISGPFHNTAADYYGYWYLADIVESDGLLEITVYDGGPSGDPVTHFYNYSSAAFTYSGSVPSPAAELEYSGDGYITGPARLAVFQTWYAEHTWSIFGSGRMIQSEPKDFYPVNFRFVDYIMDGELFPGADTSPLLQEIVAYAQPDKNAKSWILSSGTEIDLLGTDNREWLLATADGEECWLHFEGTSLDAPGGLKRDAQTVLRGLNYAD